MTLQLFIARRSLHKSITPRLRKRELHGLAKEVETLNILDTLLRALDVIEDDERLAFRFQVRLGDYIDDLAVLGEELCEGFDKLGGLDALFKVADVNAGVFVSAWTGETECTCRSAMTRTLRLVVGHRLGVVLPFLW